MRFEGECSPLDAQPNSHPFRDTKSSLAPRMSFRALRVISLPSGSGGRVAASSSSWERRTISHRGVQAPSVEAAEIKLLGCIRVFARCSRKPQNLQRAALLSASGDAVVRSLFGLRGALECRAVDELKFACCGWWPYCSSWEFGWRPISGASRTAPTLLLERPWTEWARALPVAGVLVSGGINLGIAAECEGLRSTEYTLCGFCTGSPPLREPCPPIAVHCRVSLPRRHQGCEVWWAAG